MNHLLGKKIIIGVSAGIAAYKTNELVRLLVKSGAQVKVIMSERAKEFVSALTLSVLSKHPVLDSFTNSDGSWVNHVELGLWADAMIIAPATANTIAKMSIGQCDNLLLATYLSARCKVFFAPAMDLDMYAHPTTAQNISSLQKMGCQLIEPTMGELASGLVGLGRMAEPESIFQIINNFFFPHKELLNGKKILITAGATYEKIDPVRFIGNYASGKMGVAIANTAAQMGANVVLIAGVWQKQALHPNIELIETTAAGQMYDAVHQVFAGVDVGIFAAAVADYTPKEMAQQKIKKKEDNFAIELVRTKDILASVGEIKTHQKLIGFALETHDEEAHAKEKIRKKNLDAIVLNSLNDQGAGFATDTNKISFITAQMHTTHFPLKLKEEVAIDILLQVHALLND